jgi:ADP-ribosylglycohydrolase
VAMRLESGDTLLVLLCPAWKKQRTAWNLGDDADTTGAICGQLAGAFWGESQIPACLRSGLARMDMLESALEGILATGRKAE